MLLLRLLDSKTMHGLVKATKDKVIEKLWYARDQRYHSPVSYSCYESVCCWPLFRSS